jgi:hypothetical protein
MNGFFGLFDIHSNFEIYVTPVSRQYALSCYQILIMIPSSFAIFTILRMCSKLFAVDKLFSLICQIYIWTRVTDLVPSLCLNTQAGCWYLKISGVERILHIQ